MNEDHTRVCRVCRAYQASDSTCHLNAPSVGPDGRGAWPHTHNDDTCENFSTMHVEGFDTAGDLANTVLSKAKAAKG